MFSKFSRSGVFTSPVDYFCLVCECRLRDERDANAHVVKPVHIKILDSTNYLEKNEEDCVRKIKKWYFCELCNHLLSTAARVRLHVMEAKHIENKSIQFLQRKGNFIVAFSNVLIDEKTWNGIIDDTCVICNTEFDDENIHKNKTIHIIKLIQSKAEFDTKKNIFRKIDDSSFQCLTCNMVVALSEMDVHFNITEHKNLYQKNSNFTKVPQSEEIENPNNKDDNNTQNRAIDKQELGIVDNTSKTDENANKGSNKERQSEQKVKFCLSDLEDNNIEEASCKNDSLDTTHVSISYNNDENLEKDNVGDVSTFQQELEKFVKENNMKYTENKSKIFCNTCNTNIPSSLRSLKEHVAGGTHKSKAIKQDLQIARCITKPKESNEKANLLKIPSNKFVHSVITVDGLHKDVILNERICINTFSLSLVVNHGSRLKCLIRGTNFNIKGLRLHLNSSKHENVIDKIPVIIECGENNEFVREVRPDCYHCGYCNLPQSSWEAMQNHLQTTDHKAIKNDANLRLERYMPQIVSNRLEKEMHDRFMMHMLFNSMFFGLSRNRRHGYDSDSD